MPNISKKMQNVLGKVGPSHAIVKIYNKLNVLNYI